VHRALQLLDHHRGLVDQPNFARFLARFFTGKQRDGAVHGVLLLARSWC